MLLIGNKGEDTVSFVDLASGKGLGRSPTGRMPHEMAISPDGAQAAVVAYGGKSIDLFDVATRARLKTIDLTPNEGPHGIAWLKDGRIIVTTERSQSIAVVDTAAGTVTASIKTDQPGTHMVAVTEDGTTAYGQYPGRDGHGDRPEGRQEVARCCGWWTSGRDCAQQG